MSRHVRVVLVGIGGYGEVYLSALLDELEGTRCELVGAVDPQPEKCRRLPALKARGVPLYSSLDAFYDAQSADLAVLSSPIQLHADHTCRALEGGSHVLVEKPAAAVTADVDRMMEARDRHRRFVAVGFQWSFSVSILALKKDILEGRYGAPLWGRSLTLWPRTEAYYARNHWAGRKRDAAGRWILDSPASNAMAHHLHNLLFLLGPAMDRSAAPAAVTARTSRVNPIETFDTVAAQVRTEGGARLLFLASHTVADSETVDPCFTLELERATVVFPGHGPSCGGGGGRTHAGAFAASVGVEQREGSAAPSDTGRGRIVALLRDGGRVQYPSPDATSQVAKLWRCVDVASGASEASIPCGLETARPHTACVEAIEKSGQEPITFPEEHLRVSHRAGSRLRWVEGLASSLKGSYAAGSWPELLGGGP